jgi:hypothetical protein
VEARRRLRQRFDPRKLFDRAEIGPLLRLRLGRGIDDRLKWWRVLDGLLERLDRRRLSLLFGLRLLLLLLRGLGRPEELRERALTHAGALSRH